MTDAYLVKIGMRPPHPGGFIRTETLDELGVSVTRAAEILGVRRATLSDLIPSKTSLSSEMALRIEKAFDVSMDTPVPQHHPQASRDSVAESGSSR